MTDLEKAQKELSDYLEKNPKAREFQKEIDNILNAANTQKERMQLLQDWMIDNLHEMHDKFDEITKECDKAIKDTK
jgi:hypothetical protein